MFVSSAWYSPTALISCTLGYLITNAVVLISLGNNVPNNVLKRRLKRIAYGLTQLETRELVPGDEFGFKIATSMRFNGHVNPLNGSDLCIPS